MHSVLARITIWLYSLEVDPSNGYRFISVHIYINTLLALPWIYWISKCERICPQRDAKRPVTKRWVLPPLLANLPPPRRKTQIAWYSCLVIEFGQKFQNLSENLKKKYKFLAQTQIFASTSVKFVNMSHILDRFCHPLGYRPPPAGRVCGAGCYATGIARERTDIYIYTNTSAFGHPIYPWKQLESVIWFIYRIEYFFVVVPGDTTTR